MGLFHALGEFYREGGVGMWPTTALGVAALSFAVRQLRRPTQRTLSGVWSLTLATLAAGVLGAIAGFVSTFRYVQHVPPGAQATTTMLGLSESLHNLELALTLMLLTLLTGIFGSLRRQPVATASAPG